MSLSSSSPLRIDDAARALGLTLTKVAESSLETWLRALITWNARIDLTAASDPDELTELMLADAFVLAAHVPAGARVVDVGTGAGAPGLALALARPDLAVTLVEPLQKRAAFLRTVLGSVGRADVTLHAKRGEDVAARGLRFDVAISRATLGPDEWVALGSRLTGAESEGHARSVWALVSAREKVSGAPAAVRALDVDYELPFSRKRRVAVRFVPALEK